MITVPFNRQNRLSFAVLFFILVCSLIGGAEVSWGLRSTFLCLSAFVSIVIALTSGAVSGLAKLPRLGLVSFVLFAVAAIAQIMPLPPKFWQSLPGQGLRYSILSQTGLADYWQTISLTPIASSYSALMVIASIVMVGAIVEMPSTRFRVVVIAVFSMIGIGIICGVLQLATSGNFPQFYASTNSGSLNGLYANKNHMALAMACSIIIAYYIKQSQKRSIRRANIVFIGYWAFILLALPLTNSRAGLVIGFAISLVILSSIVFSFKNRIKLVIVISASIILGIILFTKLPNSLFARFNEVPDDLRWNMLAHSMIMLSDYWILGCGLGGFSDVFLSQERLQWLFPTYVNNVHNDYVQLAIELGISGIIALVLLIMSVAMSFFHSFRSLFSRERSDVLMGFCILIAFAAHSIVDYPLRRPATLIIFVVALAAIFRRPHVIEPVARRARN